MAKQTASPQSFDDDFQTLPQREQEILKVFSLCHEPQSRTSIIKVLTACKIKDDNGKTFVHGTLKPVISRLLKSQLLVEVPWSYQAPRLACHPDFADILTEKVSREDQFEIYKNGIQHTLPLMHTSYWSDYGYPESFERLVRDIRLAIYSNDVAGMGELLAIGEKHYAHRMYETPLFVNICDTPFRPDWFASLHPEIQLYATYQIFYYRLIRLDSLTEHAAFWESQIAITQDTTLKLMYGELLATYFSLRGELQHAIAVTEQLPASTTKMANTALIHFLNGELARAIDVYESILDLYKKKSGKRNVPIMQFSGLFYPLTYLKAQPEGYLKKVKAFLNAAKKEPHPLQPCFSALEIVYKLAMNDVSGARETLMMALHSPNDRFTNYFIGLVAYWYFPERLDGIKRQLQNAFQQTQEYEYHWLTRDFAIITQKLTVPARDKKRYTGAAEQLTEQVQFKSLTKLFAPAEPWEMKLKALLGLGGGPTVQARETRLAWMLNFSKDLKHVNITPKEQIIAKSGNWSAGRNIALKRLNAGKVDGITDQDRKVIAAIHRRNDYYYYGSDYYIEASEALLALVGHPFVFLEKSPTTPIELVKEEPTLIVEERNGEYLLQFSESFDDSGVQIIKETPTRYKLLVISEEHLRIQRILDFSSLKVPEEAKDRLQKAIGNLSKVLTVHSGLEGTHDEIPVVDADSEIRLHLLPFGNGFRLDMLVRPFSTAGPYYQPGSKAAHVIAEVDGKRLQTRRNLGQEKVSAETVLAECPILQQTDDGSGEWIFETPEECLEALVELEAVREKDKAIIEWPEGERLRLKRQVSFEQMSLRIEKDHDWFGISGELKIDDGQVLEIKKLLELLEKSPGRFVEVSDGQFIALTRQFQKQLEEVRAYAEATRSGLRFHPLLSPVMEEFADQIADLEADTAWQESLERLKSAEKHNPKVPSTLQAELRDYQVDGFKWLSRLAKWGVGACLADDMGLGKTVQALAVILERAKKGPTLVIAPASVTTNWISEANRFAPTLNAHLFGGKDRQETIDGLGGLDLLVCSYGLLPQEIERLKTVQWQTIVLDEAQAIKNTATKRSKAAMQLQGDFKIITTGTPVENHLGELWNLFRFINPGLLGSLKKFNERYATPIERYQDHDARRRLRRLIVPFILRRLKSEVLDELPPKTEITLTVELSQEERAFYEALRQKALDNISAVDAQARDKRFQILAEIMRLRRACCHSRLVVKESLVSSSKLALFGQVVEELLDNRHKALVFSQFVDHLSIIREFLDEKKITYQYLDGSTPTKKRQEYVNAFQAGEGDLFLISLRAGGLGLNLTAADYVIHLDPWWNPAVEDQASDRSHRIGQQHPVTIYRLVTKDTIEEKILALHADKRDLADSLLEGTEASGKVSAEELLQIIRES